MLVDDTRAYVFSRLSGCEEALVFPTKEIANKVINRLCTCSEHHGVHHFAVFSEGQGIYMSKVGWECSKLALSPTDYFYQRQG